MNQPTAQPPVDPREGMTSASAAEADRLCPGRFLAQAGLPENPGAIAGRGDRIHAALAAQTPDGLNVDEQGVYQDCQQAELAMAQEMFGAELPQAKLFREQRYWVRLRDGKGHSGQVDLVRRLGPRAIIADYKTGFLEVADSPANEQLRDLAVLVRGGLPGVTDIAVAIIQPTISKKPSVCLYATPDIDRAEREMFERILASHNPLSPRVAGDVQCNKHYCRAKGNCVEYQKFAATMLPAMLTCLEVPVANWTPDQRVIFLDRAGAAAKWLDETKASIKAQMVALKAECDAAVDPELVLAKLQAYAPGWYLVPGMKRTEITDPQAVFDRFIALGGKPDAFMRTVKVGRGRLKDAVNAVTGHVGSTLDSDMRKLTHGCVVITTTEPTLEKEASK